MIVAAAIAAPPASVAAAPTDRTYDGATEVAAPPPVSAASTPDVPAVATPPRRVPVLPPTNDPEPPGRVPPRFVIAPTLGVAIGPPRLALLEGSLFLGASLPTRARPGNFVALGVQAVYGVYSLARGHVALHGVAGARGGLLYQVGAGPVGLRDGGVSLIGGEFEGRIAYVYTRRPQARVRGMFGALLRLGGATERQVANAYHDERVYKQPIAQGGVFVGFTRAPVARGTRSSAEGDDEPDVPPRGLGLLIPGAVLLTGFVGTALFDLVTLSRSGPDGCHGCIPLTVYALPALAAGLPLTIVGGGRLSRYRKWRMRIAVAPRITGVAIRF